MREFVVPLSKMQKKEEEKEAVIIRLSGPYEIRLRFRRSGKACRMYANRD